jgi:hypothetical protein
MREAITENSYLKSNVNLLHLNVIQQHPDGKVDEQTYNIV